jgi:hypothetical protein
VDPLTGNAPMGPINNALFPNLQKRNKERIKTILMKEGFTSEEVDGAIQEAESDHPFLDLFTTYILPILIALLKNLILAKRAAGG